MQFEWSWSCCSVLPTPRWTMSAKDNRTLNAAPSGHSGQRGQGVLIEQVNLEESCSVFDLLLEVRPPAVTDTRGGLEAVLMFNTDIFTETSVKLVAGAHSRLLRTLYCTSCYTCCTCCTCCTSSCCTMYYTSCCTMYRTSCCTLYRTCFIPH